eukprot:7989389-Pyramimonas_sp.AAC.1
MLQLALLAPLDAAQAAFPLRAARGVQIGVVVDDAGLHRVGSSEQVRDAFVQATRMLHDQLEAVNLPIGKLKSR